LNSALIKIRRFFTTFNNLKVRKLKKIALYSLCLVLFFCSKDEETQAPTNNVQTTTPELETVVVQYTLTVTAGEGRSVTNGGTFDDGTSVSVTATANEGYEFIGWEGSDSDSSSLTITLNSNTSIQALFAQLPIILLPSSPSKMFTKGVRDTLSIGFSHTGGYKSTSLSAEYGSVSIISEPNEGDTEGNIVIEYSVNTVENVDRITTIAGFDDIEINISGNDDLVNSSTYQIRSQPEPIFKDYLKPSNDLVASRSGVNIALIRYLNQVDNYTINRCNGVNENYNRYGNVIDVATSAAFADINGDGYDDIVIHSVFSKGGVDGFSEQRTEVEIYFYQNGEYKIQSIDWGGKENLTMQLTREIIVGDFDNDGDADFFLAGFGLDAPPYSPEAAYFLINNYTIDGTLDYKDAFGVETRSHEVSSADIDFDGDLDIFTVSNIWDNPVFYKNNGNFNLSKWDDITETGELNDYEYFKDYYTSEIYDVNKDGYYDIVLIGHEWENGDGMIMWGSSNGYSSNNTSLLPQIDGFQLGLDITISDLNYDGDLEIILTKSGGDDSAYSGSDNSNVNYNIGVTNFYSGWFIHILSVTSSREITDITNSTIENFYSNQTEDYCGNPENNWIYRIVVDDYDNNGALDIYNLQMDNRPLHRWEWNGSKYIEISP